MEGGRWKVEGGRQKHAREGDKPGRSNQSEHVAFVCFRTTTTLVTSSSLHLLPHSIIDTRRIVEFVEYKFVSCNLSQRMAMLIRMLSSHFQQ